MSLFFFFFFYDYALLHISTSAFILRVFLSAISLRLPEPRRTRNREERRATALTGVSKGKERNKEEEEEEENLCLAIRAACFVLFTRQVGNKSQERYWCIEMSVICIHCGSGALVLSLNSEPQSVALMVLGGSWEKSETENERDS